jgi:hypothetical protein
MTIIPQAGSPKKMPSQDFIDEKTIGVVRQPSPVWNWPRAIGDTQDIPNGSASPTIPYHSQMPQVSENGGYPVLPPNGCFFGKTIFINGCNRG